MSKTTTTAPKPTPDWLTLCLPLVKASEDCRLHAYPDPATGGKPWTIGWGCTGDAIKKNSVWTQAEADAELAQRLMRLNEQLNDCVTVPLTAAQRAALIDFAYNLGIGNLERSTLLRLLNAGSYKGAALQFSRWIHAGGRVLPGLQTRRARESALFTTGQWA